MVPESWWNAFAVVVALGLLHLLVFTVLANLRMAQPTSTRWPFFVFVVPCLNEELVIGRCLDMLLALPIDDFAALVIDDGSDDATAQIVQRYDPSRVWLLQRQLPAARHGKGAALNHAYRHLQESGLLADRDAREVVVVVCDADGRLEPDAVEQVAPYFANPRIGAVQIGVRMYNAHEGLLARLQDMEFVVFTEIYQQARNRLTTVGLGGNGQFVRLAALQALEDSPWSDCLTEDLDLGIRLRLTGWVSMFTPLTHVKQQAVTDVGRLIRQRARWFQGHLQCARLIPLILRADLPLYSALDLSWHLLGPVAILLMSVWSAMFLTALGVAWVVDPATSLELATTNPWIFGVFYVLTMGPAVVYGHMYHRRTPELGRIRVALLSHAFIVYGYLWFFAGWRAVWHLLLGRRGWAKTARTIERGAATAERGAATAERAALALTPRKLSLYEATQLPAGELEQIDESRLSVCDTAGSEPRRSNAPLPRDALPPSTPPLSVRTSQLYDVVRSALEQHE
jgi:cellulose synthase/poly-beta-1,6-N-acetylglucosamine synthase-like glycosyltransferase